VTNGQQSPTDVFEEMSDSDLLIYSALADEDAALGSRAFRELHRRYFDRVSQSCRKPCQRFGHSSDIAEDLTAAAFARAVEKASMYRPKPDASAHEQRCRTLGWIYSIAERILFDWHRNPLRHGPLNQTTDDRHVEDYGSEDFAFLMSDAFDARGNSHRLALIALVFDSILSEREQRLLMATALYRTYSPARTYMQRTKAKELAESLGMTDANMRQIRNRAIAKINRLLTERVARE